MNRTPRPGSGALTSIGWSGAGSVSLGSFCVVWRLRRLGRLCGSLPLVDSGRHQQAPRRLAGRQHRQQQAIDQHRSFTARARGRTAFRRRLAQRPEQLDGIGHRRRLVDDDRHLAPEVEAERRQRQAADHDASRRRSAASCRAISARRRAFRSRPRRATLQRAARSAPRPARDPTAWRRSAGCWSARLAMSAVNCRRARSGPTISRSRAGRRAAGRRSRSAVHSRRRPATTAGSCVMTSASQVLRKHLRVKFSDATTAGPSSATRYLA